MDNKIRIGNLTEQERTIINFLSTEERKQALLEAGKTKVAKFAREQERKMKKFALEEISIDHITATDLREEAAQLPDAQAFSFTVQDAEEKPISPEDAQALYVPSIGRMGIAWGADATWADVDGVESGINMWLNDPEEWRQRN